MIKKPRIAVLGNLCNYGYKYTSFFRKQGLDATLVISERDISGNHLIERISELKAGIPDWVMVYDDSAADLEPPALILKLRTLKLILLLRRFDFIFAITTDSSYYAQFTGRPYILHAMGSDIRELGDSRDTKIRQGYFAIRSIKKAKIVYAAFDRVFMEKINKLNIRNTRFFYIPVDTDKFKPLPAQREQDGELLLFHPTTLDWTGKGTKKYGFKGNDRFLRAFARFLKEAGNARLIMSDRGPDREETRNLIQCLGIKKFVEFSKPMTEEELVVQYQKCDIVVDQFEIGSFGVITLEAMSCAKPVIVYVDEELYKKAYPEPQPIICARTEDEIYQALTKCKDAQFRQVIGAQARGWIMKYHSSEKVVSSLTKDIGEILNTEIVTDRKKSFV